MIQKDLFPSIPQLVILWLVHCITAHVSQAQEKQTWDETWTLVVYQDKVEAPGSSWKTSAETVTSIENNIKSKLPITGKASAKVTRNTVVDEQVYASLLNALGSTLLAEDKSKERQEWLVQFNSPPPESITITITDTKESKTFDRQNATDRQNTTFQPLKESSPKIAYINGKPRVFSSWTLRSNKAPVLPVTLSKNDSDCGSHISATVRCAGGETLPVKVCVKTRFNDDFVNRILPLRLELKNLDNETRTKLLTSFGADQQQPSSGVGKPKEPMLFVPFNEATGPNTLGTTFVFSIEQQSDQFFFAFCKSSQIDSTGKLAKADQLKWYRCEQSDQKQFLKYAPRDTTPPPSTSLFQEFSIKPDDPLDHVILIGKKGGKLSLRVSECANGRRGSLGEDLTKDSKIDSKWLSSLFDFASSNPAAR